MPGSIFLNCPSCKSDNIRFDGLKKYSCPDCGWVYFQNTAASVGGILEYEGKILVVTRNREPKKGMFDFPGGFVDPDETAEEALIREVCEELGVILDNPQYLCTAPNTYLYKGIEYTTCDIFFTAKLESIDFVVQKSEIATFSWLLTKDLDPDKFGFESMKKAINIYLQRRNET
jgi:NAD+ diphosphatase